MQKNIIFNSSISQGVIQVDLEPYDIIVKDDFAVTIEWIEDLGRKTYYSLFDILAQNVCTDIRAKRNGYSTVF